MNTKLGTFFGIPLYLNYLTIIFGLILLVDKGVAGLSVYIATLFFVVLHEYGHCFAARKKGMTAKDIYITPLGGCARLSFKHHNPGDEVYIALAGPAVNLVFTLLFLPLCYIAYAIDNLNLFLLFSSGVIINLMIFSFNLFLPIFPMDGGRVMRALLAYKLGHYKATWWTVKFGQVLGCLLIAVLLYLILEFHYYQLWLTILIFMIVVYAGQREITAAKLYERLENIKIKLAWGLNSPDLLNAPLPEIIEELEKVKNVELREALRIDEVLPLLKEMSETETAV